MDTHEAESSSARIGTALVVAAIVTVVVAYPPPATGVPPLFGVGNMFVPLGLSVVALLVAAAGGAVLGSVIAPGSLSTAWARLLGSGGALLLVGAYLVTVAGFF